MITSGTLISGMMNGGGQFTNEILLARDFGASKFNTNTFYLLNLRYLFNRHARNFFAILLMPFRLYFGQGVPLYSLHNAPRYFPGVPFAYFLPVLSLRSFYLCRARFYRERTNLVAPGVNFCVTLISVSR